MIIIDYAHTPDALKNILSSIDKIRTKNENLLTIIGCGGDRDKKKRPKIGKVAAKFSSKVIFTSDNPRNEDPQQIANMIVDGIKGSEICRAAGHVISQYGSTYNETYNYYQFTVSSGTATKGNTRGGGGSISIGPVTLQA